MPTEMLTSTVISINAEHTFPRFNACLLLISPTKMSRSYKREIVIFYVLYKKVCDVSHSTFAIKWSRFLRSKIHRRQITLVWKQRLVPNNQVIVPINIAARA